MLIEQISEKKYVNVPQISDCVYGFDLMIDLM